MAQQLARRHAAEVTVLYGVVPAMLASPWAAGEGLVMAASLMADLDQQQRDLARATFAKAAAQGPINWLEGGATPYWTLLQQAPYADLIVLGQEDPEHSRSGALPPDLVPGCLNDTGKPTLIVPYTGSFEALPNRVLIAWKPAREAARAVAAALPWLRSATTVDIAYRAESDASDIDPVAALKHWLQLQGVTAAIQDHDLGPGDVGEGLLSLAADTSAELLVMGCYGHSRAREWVLGGATRTILRTMTLPVLMAH